jgi:hypothetical protein
VRGVDPDVLIDGEGELLGVEGLGAINVGDGNGEHLRRNIITRTSSDARLNPN